MMLDLQQIIELIERRAGESDYALAYGERGYDSPTNGILFSNWNRVKRSTQDWLEHHGYALEWNDEWLISYETGKAYRYSPDCYGWQPYYWLTGGGEVIGGDEIETDWDIAEEYITTKLLNNPRSGNIFHRLDLAAHGFKPAWTENNHPTNYYPRHGNEDPAIFETGFHTGQNANPVEMMKRALKEWPGHDAICDIGGVGQFDVSWSVWVRPRDWQRDATTAQLSGTTEE